jgi:putative membrane protein
MTAPAASGAWAWHPHPDVWLLVAALAGAYALALTRLGRARAAPGDRVVSRGQVLAFAAGLGSLWLAADWPVHDVGERYLFSVHMAQHTVLSLVAPPLLLLGTPPWLLRWMLRPSWLRSGLATLARPMPATVLFNTVVVVTHWPPWVEVTVGSEPAHLAAHAVLVGASFVMWLPVLNRLPELPILSYPVRMLYLFVQSIVPTVPASFLAFAERPLYAVYAAAPRAFGISAVEDQQLAGAVMKIGGAAVIWGAIVVLFFRWYSATQRDQGDVLTWDDVERELRRTKPAPS